MYPFDLRRTLIMRTLRQLRAPIQAVLMKNSKMTMRNRGNAKRVVAKHHRHILLEAGLINHSSACSPSAPS